MTVPAWRTHIMRRTSRDPRFRSARPILEATSTIRPASGVRDLGKRISDAMMTLGWAKAASPLVCKHGAAAEGGYRRPLPDTYEPLEATPVDDAGATVDAAAIPGTGDPGATVAAATIH